jgi:hypothetical protein
MPRDIRKLLILVAHNKSNKAIKRCLKTNGERRAKVSQRRSRRVDPHAIDTALCFFFNNNSLSVLRAVYCYLFYHCFVLNEIKQKYKALKVMKTIRMLKIITKFWFCVFITLMVFLLGQLKKTLKRQRLRSPRCPHFVKCPSYEKYTKRNVSSF